MPLVRNQGSTDLPEIMANEIKELSFMEKNRAPDEDEIESIKVGGTRTSRRYIILIPHGGSGINKINSRYACKLTDAFVNTNSLRQQDELVVMSLPIARL